MEIMIISGFALSLLRSEMDLISFSFLSLVKKEEEGADVVITEEVVKTAAGNCGSRKNVMLLLLEQRVDFGVG